MCICICMYIYIYIYIYIYVYNLGEGPPIGGSARERFFFFLRGPRAFFQTRHRPGEPLFGPWSCFHGVGQASSLLGPGHFCLACRARALLRICVAVLAADYPSTPGTGQASSVLGPGSPTQKKTPKQPTPKQLKLRTTSPPTKNKKKRHQ